MVVDQTDQIFHQLAQGSMLREPRDDDQEAGVAAGQDLQRLDLPSATVSPLTTCHRRRHSSVSNASRRTIRNSSKKGSFALSSPLKRLVAVASRMIPRFRLQCLAKLPSEIGVHVSAQRLQVFDHQDDLLSCPIGRFEGGGASVPLQFLPAPPGRQIGVCIPELSRAFRIALANLPLRGGTAFRARNRPY